MKNANLIGLEAGCVKCGAGLEIGYNPDRKMRHLCQKCWAAQRAANLAAWQADRAKRRAEIAIYDYFRVWEGLGKPLAFVRDGLAIHSREVAGKPGDYVLRVFTADGTELTSLYC